MPKSTLEQWRMLKAVVEEGGFAQAAAAVHKSQSTIHHAVHKLEGLLGVKLLEVEGRKARLTPAGETLLERSRHLLNQARQLEELASSLAAGVEPVVHVAVDVIFPCQTLYNALSRFSDLYPQTRVELYEVVLSGGEEMLKAGAVDVVVSPFVPTGYMGRPIVDVEFVPVVAATHPLAQQEGPIPLTELARHRQVVIRDSALNQKRDSGWLGAEQRWTVTHMATSLYIVKQGLAFARLPRSWIQDDLDRGELVALELTEGGVSRITLYLVHAHHDTAGPATRALSDLLAGQAPGPAA
ncbi:MAG: LysR family transcriptional regulator [Gammaproteobacteria bacterium]|nr:MAG: LysR family transcriptional regulator [Gammaproteobacteria bacterium]